VQVQEQIQEQELELELEQGQQYEEWIARGGRFLVHYYHR
jgi:hypothetical protein